MAPADEVRGQRQKFCSKPGLAEVIRALGLVKFGCLCCVMIATKGYEIPSRPFLETLWGTFCNPLAFALPVFGGWQWGRVSIYQVSGVICLRVSRERYTAQVILLSLADTPPVTIHQRQCIQTDSVMCIKLSSLYPAPSDTPLHLLRKHTNRLTLPFPAAPAAG